MYNQNGYGLIIVTFFATLLGLSGNIFLMNSQLDRNRKVTEHYELIVEDHKSQVKALLSSFRECTYNLEGQMVGQPLQTLPGKAVPSLGYRDSNQVIWPNYEIQTKHGPVRVDSIQVLNIPDKDGVLKDHLVVAMNVNPDNRADFKSLNQRMIRIPLVAEKIGNQITRCYYEEGTFVQDSLRDQCTRPEVGGVFTPPFTCVVPPPLVDDGNFKTCGFNPIKIQQVAGRLEIVCDS